MARFLEDEYQNFFHFLDSLRESGATNMFGAGNYLVDRFDLTRKEAREVLTSWMKTFSDDPVEDRARRAYNETLPPVV